MSGSTRRRFARSRRLGRRITPFSPRSLVAVSPTLRLSQPTAAHQPQFPSTVHINMPSERLHPPSNAQVNYNLKKKNIPWEKHKCFREVLPTIRDFLVVSSKTSREHVKDTAYHTTQNYKLQWELLQGLGGMTCYLKLHERETDWVVEAALPYLSKNQPKMLQVQYFVKKKKKILESVSGMRGGFVSAIVTLRSSACCLPSPANQNEWRISKKCWTNTGLVLLPCLFQGFARCHSSGDERC